MREGKIVCTGTRENPHASRTLAKYVLNDETFLLTSTQAGGGTTTYPGVERVRFRCPSCSQDHRYKAETLHKFMAADLPNGSTYRNLAVLGAILRSSKTG
jgi:hypothetical protein